MHIISSHKEEQLNKNEHWDKEQSAYIYVGIFFRVFFKEIQYKVNLRHFSL